MADAFRINFDSTALDQALEHMSETATEATRPAAQAGAQILYAEAKVRCPVSEKEHTFYGRNSKATGVKYTFQPGNLRSAIYQTFSADNSVQGGSVASDARPDRTGYSKATYHVAWNHKKAPYGFMVEFGTSRAPASPFMRPTFDAMKARALEQAKETFSFLMTSRAPGVTQ